MATVPAGYRPTKAGFMKDDGTGPYMVDPAGNAIQTFAKKLLTDSDGPNARLRVDVAQTSFFAGREFRTFRELSIAQAAILVIRAVVPVDTILLNLTLRLDAGIVRLSTIAAGVAGGVFAETLPIIGKNRMASAPVIAPQIVLTAGGTVTGGTTIDIMRVAAQSQGGTAASSVGGSTDDARGILPGTYFFKLESIGSETATGTFSAFWEERQT